MSLEEPFWLALKTIASKRRMTVGALVTAVDEARGEANLSSALRVYVLKYYQARSEAIDPAKIAPPD